MDKASQRTLHTCTGELLKISVHSLWTSSGAECRQYILLWTQRFHDTVSFWLFCLYIPSLLFHEFSNHFIVVMLQTYLVIANNHMYIVYASHSKVQYPYVSLITGGIGMGNIIQWSQAQGVSSPFQGSYRSNYIKFHDSSSHQDKISLTITGQFTNAQTR